jgi:protein TonB
MTMTSSVPQLLNHACKPVRERVLVRHPAPARNVCHQEKIRLAIPKPLMISVVLHLAMVSATAALCLTAEPILRHEVEKGKGGVTLVLLPASDFSRPAPPRAETEVKAPMPPSMEVGAKPVEIIVPVPEALPILPPKQEPAPVATMALPSASVITQVAPLTEPKKTVSRAATASSARSPSARGAASTARPVYNPAPVYPEAARQAGQQGIVNLDVVVTPVGTVKEVKVARTSGFASLDRAAVEAVLRWKFSDGNSNCTVRQPIVFNLEEGVEE